ncbi:MAG: CDP-diacylglycerol--glycerol-3-phosphate 3-phosphatidyltransferase [Candidatus Melainabacteria bacterium HGW-Melainabacteria-1]|nr:MAG: CDP-diacylglycerol--glycerol-3-phosphate 3-phosphatidyltransferase [Candidatus Melainabacteria bacterium HGW-Melainabacteria-1]
MTIPNLLTLLRLVLVIPFCYFVTAGIQWDTLALLIFVVAAFTDWFDGYYARRFKQLSEAGKLLDPLADKLLVAAALIAFAADSVIRLPVWTVVIVIGREFLITGLRGMLAEQRVVMAADQIGKAKTAAQMAAILIFLVSRSENAADRIFIDLGMAVYFIAVLLTLVSGLVYLWRYREILIKSFSKIED